MRINKSLLAISVLGAAMVAELGAQTQSLSCSGGFDTPMSCTVGGVPLVCKNAVGDWRGGTLDCSLFTNWCWPYSRPDEKYVIETQDEQGNLSGHYYLWDYWGDGSTAWYPVLPLTGHYNVETGVGWVDVDWSDFDGFYSIERSTFTVEPPGCNSIRGTQYGYGDPDIFGENPEDDPWYITMVKPAEIPSGSPAETTMFDGWGSRSSGDDTSGLWNQRLYPLTTNFDGRAVEEETYPDDDPTYGSYDSCVCEECVVDEVKNSTAITGGGAWRVHDDSRFGWDLVGWKANAVSSLQQFYPFHSDPVYPCGFRVYQKMTIYTNDIEPDTYLKIFSKTPYQTNRLGGDIWPSSVSSVRSGQTMTEIWP